MDLIPASLHEWVAADFACGVDPLFAGLHRFEDASYGRSYRDTAHCVHPHHQMHLPADRRQTTIVIPKVLTPDHIVHELGHVLHERLQWEPIAEPVSWYARTNHHEAFAEAFTSWLVPGHAARPDDRTLALFEQLSA
jgi:hypothetical protein